MDPLNKDTEDLSGLALVCLDHPEYKQFQ